MIQDTAFSFQLGQTTIIIVVGDITQIKADALVSSDDVYLSMGGGVSLALSNVGGDSLRDDVRKQIVPLPLGSVVVTSAGRLPALYVLHATTLGFTSTPPVDALIASLVQQILEIGSAIHAHHIALPLLGSGTAQLPKERVLSYILQSAMYFLSSKSFSIEKLTIVLFDTDGIHQTIEEFKNKALEASIVLKRIERLRVICEDSPQDQELNNIIDIRIAEGYQELRRLFYFDAIDSNYDFIKRTKLSPEDYQDTKKRISESINRSREELKLKNQLQQIEGRRLNYLEEQKALTGIGTAPEKALEIEDIRKRYDQRKHDITLLEERLKLYAREITTLRHI